MALLSESVTAKPPTGAAREIDTVQVEAPGALTVAGLQLSPLNCVSGCVATLAVLE